MPETQQASEMTEEDVYEWLSEMREAIDGRGSSLH
jgi:hypothetical protein